MVNGPVIAAAATTMTGYPYTSILSVGSLTNASNSQLATATGTFGSSTQGDLASLTYSGGNTDFTDSGISAFSIAPVTGSVATGGVFLPSIINPLNAGAGEPIGTTPIVIQFNNLVKVTVNHITAYVVNSSSNSVSVGVYTSAGVQVFSATLSCSTPSVATTTSVSSVVLQPGTYYLAYVDGDTTCKLSGAASGNSGSFFLNENHTSIPRIGTLTGLTSLPSSFTPSTSSIGAGAENVIFFYIEP